MYRTLACNVKLVQLLPTVWMLALSFMYRINFGMWLLMRCTDPWYSVHNINIIMCTCTCTCTNMFRGGGCVILYAIQTTVQTYLLHFIGFSVMCRASYGIYRTCTCTCTCSWLPLFNLCLFFTCDSVLT